MAQIATIYVICSDVPFRRHGAQGVSAVNIVISELLGALKTSGFRISLQVMTDQPKRELRQPEIEELDYLRVSGVDVLPPLFIQDGSDKGRNEGGRLHKLWNEGIGTQVEVFYPATRFQNIVQTRMAQAQADVVLTLWSPEGVAATNGSDVPVIAYHGDVEFEPWKVRIETPSLFPIQTSLPVPVAKALARIRCAGFKRAHLRLMNHVRVIANVTDCNARFYAKHGNPRSIYVRNTWTDDGLSRGLQDIPSGPPYKIIGHVGYLDRTGSTFGLHYLLNELMPAMEREMKGLDYSVHIIGSGEIAAPLRGLLQHPRLVVRGFIKDLDAELLSAQALLLLNNAGPYRAAYTRHIMAWSMGLCLIAHTNSKDAIPEMAHMENCLMADSPNEMAKLIRKSLVDQAFNKTIRQNGRRTYERFFKPESIAAELADEIQGVLAERQLGGN